MTARQIEVMTEAMKLTADEGYDPYNSLPAQGLNYSILWRIINHEDVIPV